MPNTVIQEWTDEKGWIHRIEILLTTFLIEHNLEPVVRCKDCKYFGRFDSELYCYMLGANKTIGFSEDDYCSWGTRREDVEKTD